MRIQKYSKADFLNLRLDGKVALNADEMSFAREVADRVCFLHSGTIVQEGSTDQVLEEPKQSRTQDFLRRVLRKPLALSLEVRP